MYYESEKTVIISLAALACAGFIAGCGSDKKDAASANPAKTKNEIKVGTTPGYSEQVVEFVAKEAEKEGLKVTIVPFSDYVTPNQALAQGDIDVNSYQHVPFLEAFNEKTAQNLFPSETLTSRPFVCSQINTRLCPISPTAHPLQFRTIHPTAAAPSFSWRKTAC